MTATRTRPAAFATPTRLPSELEVGRLFADIAATFAGATYPDALTAAVESVTTVALRLGARESWAAWDRWSGWAGTASPVIDSVRSFTVFGIREERPGPRWQALFAATWPAYRA